MERIVILGAGQFGLAALSLLNTENLEVCAFGDNSPRLWGQNIRSIPVLSVEEAIGFCPNLVLISVADEDRSQSLAAQARSLGFAGRLLFIKTYR